jgi:Rrf2 family protein
VFYKETEYSLRALIYIQQQNYRSNKPGKDEIALQVGAPPPYIAKILQRLVKQGMLESMKGKNGGFFFDQYKPELSLKDVVVFIEGDTMLNGCGLGLKECREERPCPIHKQFVPIRNSMNELLSIETIQNLARKLYAVEELKINNK